LKIIVTTICGTICACFAIVVVNAYAHVVVTRSAPGIGSPDPDSPRRIGAHDTVFIEEMTWMEVRDAMKAGKDTVIIPTGGVEQCGPYLAMGKHNFVLRATTDAIARKLGNALVAPIIPFVPEGDIDPPTYHMKYAGTISLTEPVYRALLKDLCACFRTHGFAHLVLLGDSYENLEGMEAVAKELDEKWAGGKTRVHYIGEYYNYKDVGPWLKQHGIKEIPEWVHDDFSVTAMMMTVNPDLVRAKERIAAGKFKINAIDLNPIENTVAWGQKLVDFRAGVAADAIRRARTGEARAQATNVQPGD
jgi:creatinine amidohydrolase/Fe(II)-dependent formamide hydrolase-like protein